MRQFKQIKIIIALALLLSFVSAQAHGSPSRPGEKSTGSPRRYVWYETNRQQTVYRDGDEAAVFFKPGTRPSNARMIEIARFLKQGGLPLPGSNQFAMFARIGANRTGRIARLSRFFDVKAVSPVFRRSPSNPKARMALTGEIIIHFKPGWNQEKIDGMGRRYGLKKIRGFNYSPNTFLFRSSSPLNSLWVANKIQRSGMVLYAYPNWLRTMFKRAIPNDTLFANQWHLLNTGQGGGTAGEDANVTTAWDYFKGSPNEVIAVVDDGLETGHEDLAANVLAGYHWDWVGNDSNPNPGTFDNHGTAVAGVAAGRGFNALGVSGVAPEGNLVGYRLLGANTDANEADAMTKNWNIVDISSNSWGPADDARLEAPGPLTQSALKSGATNGRNGKGIVYVWAGGNGFDKDNANYDGYVNSRYTIAVGASTNLGKRSAYSERGANLIVNAPSNGGTLGITTTDRTGGPGYSATNYTSGFGGTSSAAPLVSGAVALMLQANPNLSWRDVQYVLMTTAEKNDPTDSDWKTNGAGYHINHKYGFGRVDASAAVDAAKTWRLVAPGVTATSSATPNLPIPDNNGRGVVSNISVQQTVRVEYVDVSFNANDHPYWGDLEIVLTSPAGTQSTLAMQHTIAANTPYNNWRFGSARHLGESAQGNWSLTVRDLKSGNTGTFKSWTLSVHGIQLTPR